MKLIRLILDGYMVLFGAALGWLAAEARPTGIEFVVVPAIALSVGRWLLQLHGMAKSEQG